MRFLLGLKPVVLSILVCAASTSASLLNAHGNGGNHDQHYSVNRSDLHDHVSWDIGVVHGTSFVAQRTHMEHQRGLTTWLGTINETSHVTVTWNSSDRIESQSFHLTIAVHINQHHILQYESKSIRDFVLIETSDIEIPEDSPRDAHTIPNRGRITNFTEFDTHADTAPSGIVDLMILYTNDVKNVFGSAIESKIVAAVALANSVLKNSEIHFTLRLVHSEQYDIDESQTYGEMLANVQHSKSVGALRDSFGADIVQILVNNKKFCGMSSAMHAGAGASFAPFAFSVVNYLCLNAYSHIHEIGHVLGANHDAENCGNIGYPDNYAQKYCSSGGYRTVMSYGCDNIGVPRVPYFSNPFVSYKSLPTGVIGKTDNARVLNVNWKYAADFRSPKSMVTEAPMGTPAETPAPAGIPTPTKPAPAPTPHVPSTQPNPSLPSCESLGETCYSLTSVGDRKNGIMVFYDATCVPAGGIGCGYVLSECRLCKTKDSQSDIDYVQCPCV